MEVMLLNKERYLEVNAQQFLSAMIQILSSKELTKDILSDDHYIFRIYQNAVEVGYPEDKPIIFES